jgi:hypothetical protein
MDWLYGFWEWLITPDEIEGRRRARHCNFSSSVEM